MPSNPNIIMGAQGVPDTYSQDAQIAASMMNAQAQAQMNALAIQTAKRETDNRTALAGGGDLEGQLQIALKQGDMETAAKIQTILKSQAGVGKIGFETEDLQRGQRDDSVTQVNNAIQNAFQNGALAPGDVPGMQAIVQQLARSGVVPPDMLEMAMTQPQQFGAMISGGRDASEQQRLATADAAQVSRQQTADAATSRAATDTARFEADYGKTVRGTVTPMPSEPTVQSPVEVSNDLVDMQQARDARAQLPEGAKDYTGTGAMRPDPSLPKFQGVEGQKLLNKTNAQFDASNPHAVITAELRAKDSFDRTKAIGQGVASTRDLRAKTRLITGLLKDYNGGAGVQTLTKLKSLGESMFGMNFDGLKDAEAANAISNQIALQLRGTGEGAGMPGAMSDKDREFLIGMVPGIAMTPQGREVLTKAYEINYQRALARQKASKEYQKRNGGVLDADFETSPEMQAVSAVDWYSELYDIEVPVAAQLGSDGNRDWSTASDEDLRRGL